MDIQDLINWSALSVIISGNSESIRRNRIPTKYQEQVRIFIRALTDANNKLRQYEIKHQDDSE